MLSMITTSWLEEVTSGLGVLRNSSGSGSGSLRNAPPPHVSSPPTLPSSSTTSTSTSTSSSGGGGGAEYDYLKSVVEYELKRIIELSHKFQKRTRKHSLAVHHINLALSLNGSEHVYGLTHEPEIVKGTNGESVVVEDAKLSLVEYAKRPLPDIPLRPELHYHWLAVHGVQPRIPENPIVIHRDSSVDVSNLPIEMQRYFDRITSLLMSTDEVNIDSICKSLSVDCGIQELVGYICKFLFVQVRVSLQNLSYLKSLVRAIFALIQNPNISIEKCLHQILPTVLTCTVGSLCAKVDARDSSYSVDDELNLRQFAASVVKSIITKYSGNFGDLLPRVCKTYLQAIEQYGDEVKVLSLGPLYGALFGLQTLGARTIKTVLLPNLRTIQKRLEYYELNQHSQVRRENGDEALQDEVEPISKIIHTKNILLLNACTYALVLTLGNYMKSSLSQPLEINLASAPTLRAGIEAIDNYAELLVPFYVAAVAVSGNSKLVNCCELFI